MLQGMKSELLARVKETALSIAVDPILSSSVGRVRLVGSVILIFEGEERRPGQTRNKHTRLHQQSLKTKVKSSQK